MSKEELIDDLLQKIPQDGFLKVSSTERTRLPSEKKIALIRKGNELYNQGQIELAKRIFVTTGYTDGLIRVGDYYYERKMVVEALKMYWIAPNPRKVEYLIERSVDVVKKWINDEKSRSEK